MTSPPRIRIVATLKNEGPYLVEWIGYHRAIGVSEFTLFSNDCSDGTNLMLDRLAAMGVVEHFDNPLSGRMDPQRRAYSRAARMAQVRASDWVLVIDADEFVNVHVGDGTLPALIDACGEADAISLGWQLMGSGGAARWTDAPVTQRFTTAGSVEPPENGMVPGFKTLFRPAVFDYFGVHRPKFDKKRRETFPAVRWRNGSGAEMGPDIAVGGWRFRDGTAGYDLARVNHYAVKSREEFILKRMRGSANTKNEDRLDLSYWKTFDLNSLTPPPIRTDGMTREVARLMGDGDLAALRRACIATARKVLDTRLEEPDMSDFVAGDLPGDIPDLPAVPQGSPQLAGSARQEQTAPGPGHRFVMVATMKNEAPYLQEWLVWHRLIGVDHFVVLTNDCTDATDQMLDRLAKMGLVEHLRNDDYGTEAPHYSAMRLAWKQKSVRRAEWVVHIDADEFLDLSAGDGSLADFVAACDPARQADAISLVWRYMGSHGHALPEHVPLTRRFLRGSRIVPRETPTAFSFKTMFRPGAFRGMGIHRPRLRARADAVRWINASGQDITETMTASGPHAAATKLPPHAVGFDHGAIRHYAVKSRAEFLCKRQRGSATSSVTRFYSDYFVSRNINTVALPPLGGARLGAALDALRDDARLNALQRKAEGDLDASVARLLEDPPSRRFIETGRTDDPRSRPRGRLLCVATHHKTGTMWIRYTLRQTSREQGIPMQQLTQQHQIRTIAASGPQILVNWSGDFPRMIYEAPDARFIHVIRDPRDVLLSGMRYHLTAPHARERFLLETRPEWNGQTYQEYLNALPDTRARLLFEMEHKHRSTVEEMLAWEFGRANTIELRYEDLIADTECALFRAALAEADIDGLDIDRAVRAFWRNALFGGLADPAKRDQRLRKHIDSGAPEQWRQGLPREVAEIYADRFGEALRTLGYAADDSWVAECRPAARIDADSDPAGGTARGAGGTARGVGGTARGAGSAGRDGKPMVG